MRAWAAPPRRGIAGLRAILRVRVRATREARRHIAPNRDLAASKRGNCTIRGATRRRHAVARLLMMQNPHLDPNRVRLRHPCARGPGSIATMSARAGGAAPTSARTRPNRRRPAHTSECRTHERKDQAAAPSHSITRQPHRPVMQYSQERGTHRHLKHQFSRATKPKSHPPSSAISPSS